MRKVRSIVAGVSLFAVGVSLAGVAVAGPLDPITGGVSTVIDTVTSQLPPVSLPTSVPLPTTAPTVAPPPVVTTITCATGQVVPVGQACPKPEPKPTTTAQAPPPVVPTVTAPNAPPPGPSVTAPPPSVTTNQPEPPKLPKAVKKPPLPKVDRPDSPQKPIPAAAPTPPAPGDPLMSPPVPYGPALPGVPNFTISSFEIPPFLLPIYQAAGQKYEVPWQILAAINKIETDFGRNLAVSTAGAEGWMQFIPSTWKMYGIDANGDGYADPWNPVDAIFGAANYLSAAGIATDVRQGIFAYNHADWYVDQVLMLANVYSGFPASLVSSVSGLALGRFPLLGSVSYTDEWARFSGVGMPPDGIHLWGQPGAAAIATQDVTIRSIVLPEAAAKLLGDAQQTVTPAQPGTPGTAATTTTQTASTGPRSIDLARLNYTRGFYALPPLTMAQARRQYAPYLEGQTVRRQVTTQGSPGTAATPGVTGVAASKLPEGVTVDKTAAAITVQVQDAVGNLYTYGNLAGLGQVQYVMPDANGQVDPNGQSFIGSIRPGVKLPGGSAVGTLAEAAKPYLTMSVKPSGGPTIDPKPLLDGYRLQEASSLFALSDNPLLNPLTNGNQNGNDQLADPFLATKEQLQKATLSNPHLDIYACGRQDIERGTTDRRVLAVLQWLTQRGFNLSISSLTCGHGYLTAGGNVSAHSYGSAVDISRVNGQVITPATQGPGSITDIVIKQLLTLQGPNLPAQIISLEALGGPSFALSDHDDHIHVGYQFVIGSQVFGAGRTALAGSSSVQDVKPSLWRDLFSRIGKIENPKIRARLGSGSLKVVGKGDKQKIVGPVAVDDGESPVDKATQAPPAALGGKPTGADGGKSAGADRGRTGIPGLSPTP